MKIIKSASLVTLAFFCTSLWVSKYAFSSDNIKWHSYIEGMESGKKNKKKVFLYFYSNSCGYCEDMEKVTFKDVSVIEYLDKNFISVKVNADREKNAVSSYNIRGLPSNWFIGEKGESISNLPGYVPPGMLHVILKYIHTDSYKSMSFKSYINNQISSGKKLLK
ncbi:MAG: thioredoxin family protein [Desulfobacteraceae bacterium]|nr:MAG: thioredoxin family protein [Desulfobacteraceae bacterium]